MDESLLFFGEMEIANRNRVMSYAGGAGTNAVIQKRNCLCDNIPEAFGEDPYVDPEADDAPWYDPAVPASKGFLGVWVEKVEGLRTSPFTRVVSERVGAGYIPGRGRMNHRELVVDAWIWAVDQYSADYGLAWLSSVLRNDKCLNDECAGCVCEACAGADLRFLACCPTLNDDDTYTIDWRTLTNVSLIEGPELVQIAAGTECGAEHRCDTGGVPVYQIQFTLAADPWVWEEAQIICEDVMWPAPTGNEPCNVQWVTDCADPANPGCPAGSSCIRDEECPPPPSPPRSPVAGLGCICLPLQAVGACCEIPAEVVPKFQDAALRISVTAGGVPIRNLSFRVIPNPQNLPPEELTECDDCARYYVSYIPANATLTIDGQREEAITDCPDGTREDSTMNVYGSGAGPVRYQTLSCGLPYMVCSAVDVNEFDPGGSSFTVEVIGRTA